MLIFRLHCFNLKHLIRLFSQLLIRTIFDFIADPLKYCSQPRVVAFTSFISCSRLIPRFRDVSLLSFDFNRVSLDLLR